MFRVVITVLLHGLVFLGLWWQQSQDTVAQPDDFSSGLDYWQQSMSPIMWALWALMLLTPALALLSCKRQSIRGWGLLVINWLFVPVIAYVFYTYEQYMYYQTWLVFSVVMLGIAILNGLSARLARVPQQVGKNKK